MRPPWRPRARARGALRLLRRRWLLSGLLACLVLAGAVGGWNAWLRPANASYGGTLPSAPSSMTFQQYLHNGRQNVLVGGPQSYKGLPPAPPPPQHSTNYATLLPSAEPPTMQPITRVLAAAYFQGGSGGSTLDLRGSDGRLEVLVQPGAFDLAQASVPAPGGGSLPPSGPLRLVVSELDGYFAGQGVSLGRYQVQLEQNQGQLVSGVIVRVPLTLLYHYQPATLAALGLDGDCQVFCVRGQNLISE